MTHQWLIDAESDDNRDALSCITTGIYISNYKTAVNVEQLEQTGIRTVISMSNRRKQPDTLRAYRLANIRTYQVPVEDDIGGDIITAARIVNSMILQLPKPVLIHCDYGVSRSVAATAYHLMITRCWSAERAILFIKKQRPVSWPNHGFITALETKVNRE